MSLINDALKKAQRQRTEDTVDPTGIASGGVIAKRGQARSAKSIFVLGAAALVLILLSVGGTVYLVNRAAPTPTATVASAQPTTPKAEPAATAPAPGPTTTAPAPKEASPLTVTPPAVEPKSAPPPLPPAPAPTPPTATDISSTPATSVAATPAPAATGKPDDRIHAFIEGLRITGVKPAGAESRVLMNDRVYRLNDIVERTLGVRLIKVDNGALTFSDSNGVLYTKYF